MKVLLLSDMQEKIAQSGVGRALEHQKLALSSAGIPYTLDHHDSYDLIHINTVFPQSYLRAKQAHFSGKPVVYHAHSTREDFGDSFVMSNYMSKAFGSWLKRCYSSADLILTPTNYSRQLLIKAGITVPIKTISNGIDIDYWQASQAEIKDFKQQYNITEGQSTVISIGMQIKRKGILDFITLAKKMPDVCFIWFGYTDPKYLPKKIRDALKSDLPNLTFAGYVDRDDIRIAFQAADLFLFLTHEETEGIVLLEALASRISVLIRDIPVFNYLTHGKDVYKIRDIDQAEGQCRDILERQIADTTTAGFDIANERNIQNIGKLYQSYYAEAIGNCARDNSKKIDFK